MGVIADGAITMRRLQIFKLFERAGCVKESGTCLTRTDVDLPSSTLPLKEEEPRVTSYAAAEMVRTEEFQKLDPRAPD